MRSRISSDKVSIEISFDWVDYILYLKVITIIGLIDEFSI